MYAKTLLALAPKHGFISLFGAKLYYTLNPVAKELVRKRLL